MTPAQTPAPAYPAWLAPGPVEIRHTTAYTREVFGRWDHFELFEGENYLLSESCGLQSGRSLDASLAAARARLVARMPGALALRAADRLRWRLRDLLGPCPWEVGA